LASVILTRVPAVDASSSVTEYKPFAKEAVND
jgi:hypothetical protein